MRWLLVLACALSAIGLAWSPDAASKASVTLYLSTDCPVAMQYTPRINRLTKTYEARGVTFQAYFPNEGESPGGIATYGRERGYGFPLRLDVGGEKARADGIARIPTAVVRDAAGRVVYRGAIDDHKDVDLARNAYLADALEAALAGRKPRIAKTEAFGCELMVGPAIPTVQKVNYAENVAAILADHCLTCHRPGEVAPFSLVGYENARKWSRMIASVTERGKMPPWKAAAGIGEFHDENRLTPAEIETLRRWAEAGAPRGSREKEPKSPDFPAGWTLGEPDMVLQMPDDFKIAAEGKDQYRHFVIKPDIKEPVYVNAVDVRPGNNRAVHHVILYLDEKGVSERLERQRADGQIGYDSFGSPGFVPDGSLGGWAPGTRARRLPSGSGILLKPGTRVVMQVHYHRTGKEEIDRTRVGLYFAKEPVKSPIEIAWLFKFDIFLPAGRSEIVQRRTFPIRRDTTLYALMPHMHMLGRRMEATLELPDGARRPLIRVDDWDFNWQLTYHLKEPMRIPRGSKLHVVAVYDNSEANPNNPNRPPKTVFFGEETTDEMFLLVAYLSMG